MRKFFPRFFGTPRKKKIQRTTPEVTTLWISFLHGRRSKMWRLLWRPWTPSILWPGRSMNILRKGSIFFNFFCKKGAFHLPTLQVSGKTSSNLQVSGDIRQFSGYNFAVGSTRNLWITWGGSYPGMLAGWLGALSWLLTPEKQVKGNQWLNIRPQ